MNIVARFIAIAILSSTALAAPSIAANRVSQGTLQDNQYVSSAAEFSLSLPQGTEIFDGRHPLGGYLVITDLPEPIVLWGLSYNRIAQPEGGLDEEALKSAVSAGQQFWAASYEENPLETIRESWVQLHDTPMHFAVLQSSGGNLVYTTLSLHAGNFVYVLFERRENDRDTSPANDAFRRASLQNFLDSMTFDNSAEIKFRMQE